MNQAHTGQVLSKEDKVHLEEEFVSTEARLRLTRLLREVTDHKDQEIRTIQINRAANVARAVLGLPIYRLHSGGEEYYMPVEHAWHYGELELIMRRPSTSQIAETIADLVRARILGVADVNAVLEDEKIGFRIIGESHADACVQVASVEELDDKESDAEHPNIRTLLKRMDVLLEERDTSGVLHASATIFETLAKDVVNNPQVANETLGSFIEQYRKKSALAGPLLDFMFRVYKRRNTEPLAGHGHLSEPTVTLEEAQLLRDFTRMIVRHERRLAPVDANPTYGSTSVAALPSASV